MIDTGRFHYNVLFVFCECELHPCTLLRHGFWASSPAAPNIAISTKLLREMTLLMLESDVSAKAFIQMLRWKNAWSECEVSVLTLATYVAKLNCASDFIIFCLDGVHKYCVTPFSHSPLSCQHCPSPLDVTERISSYVIYHEKLPTLLIALATDKISQIFFFQCGD